MPGTASITEELIEDQISEAVAYELRDDNSVAGLVIADFDSGHRSKWLRRQFSFEVDIDDVEFRRDVESQTIVARSVGCQFGFR